MSDRPSVQTIRQTHGIPANAPANGMSLDDVGKVLAPFSASPELFTPLLKVSDALWSNLGVKGQKRFAQEFEGSYSTVAARFLQALVNQDCHIAALWDTATGCFVEAKQPADVFSMRGTLGADVIDVSSRLVRVEVATETKGQLFDWGKSKRLVEQVFERTRFYLTKI